MNYTETLKYLYDKLPMFSRIGSAAYKKDLHNTIAFCNYLNNPEHKFKSIHVAGTNGKGSVTNMLASILQEAGYKVGVYTSPHLVDFRERIKINGQYISKNYVAHFITSHQQFIAQLEPSFFEVTVGMAYTFFAEKKVDIAIIETGLGGRLDSTNIITPLQSIITNIGFDHMNILGNTLPLIAAEKAGIIKKNIPVIIGKYQKEIASVFIDKAQKENAPITFVKNIVRIKDIRQSLAKLKITVAIDQAIKTYSCPLAGNYQAENMATVLASVNSLPKEFKVSQQNIKDGFANVLINTKHFGRFQLIANQPTIIADVAHNKDGIKALIKQIKQFAQNYKTIVFVMGMVKDKDISTCIKELPKSYKYIATEAPIPRALPTNELLALMQQHHLATSTAKNVNRAISQAKSIVGKKGLVVVCGSIFLVGAIKNITKLKA
jgi:dihydrofolate synthase / folylpolyglutamate synthase